MITAAARIPHFSIGARRKVFFPALCLSENKATSNIIRSFKKASRFSSEASTQSRMRFSSSMVVVPLKYLYNSSWFLRYLICLLNKGVFFCPFIINTGELGTTLTENETFFVFSSKWVGNREIVGKWCSGSRRNEMCNFGQELFWTVSSSFLLRFYRRMKIAKQVRGEYEEDRNRV